jgi:hypothetical protein
VSCCWQVHQVLATKPYNRPRQPDSGPPLIGQRQCRPNRRANTPGVLPIARTDSANGLSVEEYNKQRHLTSGEQRAFWPVGRSGHFAF